MMNLTQKTSEGRKIAQIVLPKIFYQVEMIKNNVNVLENPSSIEKLIKLTLKKLNKDDK